MTENKCKKIKVFACELLGSSKLLNGDGKAHESIGETALFGLPMFSAASLVST